MSIAPDPPRRRNDPRRELLKRAHREFTTAMTALHESLDAKRIHKARVATRRLRATLKAMHKEMQPTRYAELQFPLRRIGRILTPLREADVRQQILRSLLHETPVSRQRRELVERLHQFRRQAAQDLRKQLRHSSLRLDLSKIEAGIADPRLLPQSTRTKTASYLERSLVATLHRTRRKLQSNSCSAKHLHKTRIAVKNARYFLQALSASNDKHEKRRIAQLCELQDVLGDIHDRSMLIAWLSVAQISPTLRTTLIEGITKDREEYLRRYRHLRKQSQ